MYGSPRAAPRLSEGTGLMGFTFAAGPDLSCPVLSSFICLIADQKPRFDVRLPWRWSARARVGVIVV